MPCGLTNAHRTFRRLMDQGLREENGKLVHVYLDDISIFSEEHLQHLATVFKRLRDAGLRLQPSKRVFVRRESQFLLHVVSKEGLTLYLEKVRKVKEYP